MSRKLYRYSASALFAMSCHKESLNSNASRIGDILKKGAVLSPVLDGDPISKEKWNQSFKTNLLRHPNFNWNKCDLTTIWSAVQYGDTSLAIGYKPAGIGDVSASIHKIDIHTYARKSVHDALIELVVYKLNQGRSIPLKAEDIIIEDDPILPIIALKLSDKVVITELYNLENVRHLEPLDYWPFSEEQRSPSGCSSSTYGLNSSDYSSTYPNCFLPWNFHSVSIPAAWSTARGRYVTFGVMDAGISSSQPLLGAEFNKGDSNVGRTITTGFTYRSSANSSCTHGTSMCGLACGPRNSNGATSGIAYEANLHFIRGCEDLVLNKSSEKTGVKNALIQMENRSAVKVVSMSVGSPFSSSVLWDGVNYAYNNGKMLMTAAGTSYSFLTWWGVIYPAAYSQCAAITDVKENGSTCDSCHDGSEVDFTIPMERNNNSSRNSLSLFLSGNSPTYIGGSSAATATAAGIAAMVWSVNPSFTRAQVYNFLLTTSQNYPSVTSNYGYGNLNASAAVSAASTH